MTFFCCILPAKDDALLFDNLFPATLYQQTLDTAMQIWEDIRSFNEGTLGLDEQTGNDLLVGRLTRLKRLIEQLAQEHNKKPLLEEDREYLQSIMGKIKEEYQGNNEMIKKMVINSNL